MSWQKLRRAGREVSSIKIANMYRFMDGFSRVVAITIAIAVTYSTSSR